MISAVAKIVSKLFLIEPLHGHRQVERALEVVSQACRSRPDIFSRWPDKLQGCDILCAELQPSTCKLRCRGTLAPRNTALFLLREKTTILVFSLQLLFRPLLDLGQVPFFSHLSIMAPITETTVSDLKDLVHKLEARVHHLESWYESGGKTSPSTEESMRMILLGPPGAGRLRRSQSHLTTSSRFGRQRNASSQDQGAVSCLPSRTRLSL